MSNPEQSPISTYEELQSRMKTEKEHFDARQKSSYWQRYVVRRIPLFTIPILVFYASILALGFVDEIAIKAVNSLVPSLPYAAYITSEVLCALLVVALVHSIFVGLKYKNLNQSWEVCNKLIFNVLMLAIVYSISALIYYQIHVVALGLVVFAPLCILPLLVDRTLGWTRQNDRFKLFSSKMQGLIDLNLTRASLGVAFSESNVFEYIGILEQFESQKFNETVSDSFYILNKIEQLKPQVQ